MPWSIYIAVVSFLNVFIVMASRKDLSCFVCDSHINGTENDLCPVFSFVDTSTLKPSRCSFGACYTMLDKVDGQEVAYRGCTNDLEGVPYSLPSPGCYGMKGKQICICFSSSCNMLGSYPANSYKKEFDDHLKNPANVEERGKVKCYQCSNYDAEGQVQKKLIEICPKDGGVETNRAYNDYCNSTCYTRSFADNPGKVTRGCTDSQWGLPVPLPPDGCYNWDGAVWCVCNTPDCNEKPMGKSSGRDFDAHLEAVLDNYIELDGMRRCFECVNYGSDGTYYKQCPKNSRVRNAWVRVCNETCFTRSYDYDDKKIARGCTDTQYGLPNPLPPDGCYKWYSEVWCVCSKTRCNGKAIGEPQDIEFDAHIAKYGTGGATRHQSSITSCLFLAIIFMGWSCFDFVF